MTAHAYTTTVYGEQAPLIEVAPESLVTALERLEQANQSYREANADKKAAGFAFKEAREFREDAIRLVIQAREREGQSSLF